MLPTEIVLRHCSAAPRRQLTASGDKSWQAASFVDSPRASTSTPAGRHAAGLKQFTGGRYSLRWSSLTELHAGQSIGPVDQTYKSARSNSETASSFAANWW